VGPKDTIRQTLDLSDRVVGAYIGDLTDSDLLIRPVPGMNHIAWQLGHLISSERQMMESLRPGTCPALPEGFEEAHSKEGATSGDTTRFSTKAQYQQLMADQREATLRVLEAVAESELDRGGDDLPPYAPTVGALLNMVGVHFMMHTGQFVAVRRMLGKPVTI
jgi:hypothetical protein